ncbi:MAG: zf-TFIIB domain-containing protein [Myxococcota bacterium]
MPPRRPEPTAESKARAARIAKALEGLLDDLPAAPEASDEPLGGPYRPRPKVARPSGRRQGLDCPACGQPLAVEVARGIEVHRCTGCAGLWLDPGELESMVDDPGPVEPDIPTIRSGMAKVGVPKTAVAYRKCPRCGVVMERRNFGSHSGVVVDECREHGIFLDPGEFEAIEAFISLGGLSLERANELRRLKAEVRRAEREAAHAKGAASVPNAQVQSYSSWGSLLSWFF